MCVIDVSYLSLILGHVLLQSLTELVVCFR